MNTLKKLRLCPNCAEDVVYRYPNIVFIPQVGTRFLEMKEDDFVKALMYSIEKSYEYGCINNELLDAEVLNSIKLKEYNVDDKN